jgi:hypothetical protein
LTVFARRHPGARITRAFPNHGIAESKGKTPTFLWLAGETRGFFLRLMVFYVLVEKVGIFEHLRS